MSAAKLVRYTPKSHHVQHTLLDSLLYPVQYIYKLESVVHNHTMNIYAK